MIDEMRKRPHELGRPLFGILDEEVYGTSEDEPELIMYNS